MELFVRTFLDSEYDVIGGLEEGSFAQQQLFYLVKKGGVVANVEVHQGMPAS
jgi:hypothetical protein